MKLLKVEDHNYSIVYVNDNENYNVYRRFNENRWEIFSRNKWKDISSFKDLEKLFNKNKNKL